MHRRRFVHAATLAGAALPLATLPALAQSTPSPAGDETLAGRVASIDPVTLLEALLTTPVTTPLLPADTPPVEPVAWDDASDSDLIGTVGGVLFETGRDAYDNPAAIATAIVHPDAESAAAVLAEVGPADTQQLLGMPWFVQGMDDYAVSVVQVGYLLLAGGAEAPEDDPPAVYDGDPGATPAATPAESRHVVSLELRAISHMTALLDHLDAVLATLAR